MQVPLEISFRGVQHSPELEAFIGEQVQRLHRFAGDIISCRIAVEKRHQHQESGNPFRVRIELKLPPGKDLVVKKRPGDHELHDSLHLVIQNAFKALERQLKKAVEQRRGEIKTHEEPRAVVAQVVRDGGYGFIVTPNGREIFFHKNAVLNGGWDDLDVGTEVRYVQAMGDEGPQASTVHVVSRLGLRDIADSTAPPALRRRARRRRERRPEATT
ncbi:MAG: HPF/RaiA family ribosome-associated protein [Acidobacteria bacterium]|nr:HPF/RaiA family ribosome-associated protein [Acidobacteriota bacterium]